MAAKNGPAEVGHDWLHRELNVAEGDQPQMEVLRDEFHVQRQEARDRLKRATESLGQIIVEEQTFSPRVREAVEQVHKELSDLQHLTLNHIFEMETVLPPDQYQRLLELAGKSMAQ